MKHPTEFRSPWSPRARLLLTLAAALSLGLSACDETTVGAPDVVDTEDTKEPEIGPLPTFGVRVTATPLSGNAPLAVQLSASVVGDEVTLDDLELKWQVGDTATYDGPEVEHTFPLKGNATVKLTGTFRTSDGRVKTEQDEVLVRVAGCAGLRFTQVSVAQPVELAPGDTLTLQQGKLINDGDVIESPFEVRLVASLDDKYDPDTDLVISAWQVDSMAAGVFSESSIDLAGQGFTVPDIEDGSYVVFLVADALNTVNECSEDDNVATSTNAITIDTSVTYKADLQIVDVSFPAGLQLKHGQIFNYSYRVKNVGLGDAGKFSLGFWLSEDQVLDPETDTVILSPTDNGSSMKELKAGGSQSFFRSWKVPEGLPDGEYYIIGKADVGQTVVEDDEDNNVGISPEPLTVKFVEVQCFDLALDEIVVSPLSSYWNGSVQLTAKVTNGGTQPTPDGWPARAYLSNQPSLNPASATVVGNWSLPSIPAGQTVVIDQVVKIPSGIPVSPHWVGLQLDPETKLAECNEGNNAKVFGESVSIASKAQVDLAVSQIQFHPQVAAAGESIKVTYNLSNNGSTAATAFKLGVVFSQDATINATDAKNGKDYLVHDIIIGTVPAGATLQRVEDVVVPLALPNTLDTFWVGVVADLDNNQPSDTNKNNNVAVATQTLTVQGAMGGCFEDDVEPNNTASAAQVLEPGLHEGMGSCGNDDWWRVQVPAGHSLVVDMAISPILSIQPVPSDIDLVLLDAAQKVVKSSTNAGDAESVHVFTVPEDGEYFLRVHGKTAAVRAHYDLHITLMPPVEGIDLLVADVAALPGTLYPGGVINVAWSDVNLGDTPAPPHLARIWASKDIAIDAGDTVVAEVMVDGTPALTTLKKSVDLKLPEDIAGGNWWFIVETDADDDVVEASETNNRSFSDKVFLDAGLTCADDALEPNDTSGLASLLTFNGTTAKANGSVVCPKLDDWYAFDVEAGQAVTVQASYTYDATKGLLALELWDPSETALLLKNSSSGNAQVTLPWVWRSGRYYVRVGNQAQNGKQGPYTYNLTVTATTADPGQQCDADLFEDNNSFQTAEVLGCGYQTATLCKGDYDVYRMEVTGGQQLEVTLNQAKSELSMALYGDPLAPALASKVGNGKLVWTAPQDQLVYLRVSAKSDPMAVTDVNYSLLVDGVPGVDLSATEPSLFLTEVYQGEDTLVDFSVVNSCQDPSTAFMTTLWLSKDERLDASDIDLSTVELPGVGAKGSLALSQKLSVPFSTTPGNYHVIVEVDSMADVHESNEDNNTRGAPLTVAKLCLPDAYEPNDLLMPAAPHAPVVEPPGATDLALCPFEIDWFAIEVVEPGTVLTVAARFSHAEGDLDLRLYDPVNSKTIPVAVATSKDDDEVITWDVAAPGVYLVRVHGFDGASADYDLEVFID